ncbi:MAG: AmmeMemoRadiSam system radical SAM enzyme [Dehalococcoidia bacterium]
MQKEAMLYEKMDAERVHCYLCAHNCKITEGRAGVCRVRRNEGGLLNTLVYGRTIAANVDPIEKKPLFHFLPGSRSFSIATVGCNFQCAFCQNWQISQASRTERGLEYGQELPPSEVVGRAKQHGCASIAYTYTEPTIFFEYAYDTARLARQEGLANLFVTNGYMTKEALDTIKPYLDAANVDLKSFNDSYYKKVCKAQLQPVLDSISYMKEIGLWVEVTTLVIPDENDSDEELGQIASFVAGVDSEIPWHISRFRPDYRYSDRSATPIESLKRARDIGYKHGLKYVYLGNVPENLDTICPECGHVVVRRGYAGLQDVRLIDGKCPNCDSPVSGVWSYTAGNRTAK